MKGVSSLSFYHRHRLTSVMVQGVCCGVSSVEPIVGFEADVKKESKVTRLRIGNIRKLKIYREIFFFSIDPFKRQFL